MTVIALMVRVPVPPLFRVTVLIAPVVPTFWSGNATLVGDRVTAGVIPVPLKLAVWGLPAALSGMVTVPVLVPVAVGVKVTLIMQLAPATREVPQLLVWPKSPLTPILPPVMERGAVPLLVSVKICALLVVPTFWPPKVRLEGVSVATGPLMVSVSAAVRVNDPEVPVIVTVEVPSAAVELAVSSSTLVEVAGFVPKLAVTPLGSAEVESVTDPVKPPEGVTVMVLLPFEPCATVRLPGEAASEKSGGALIVRLMEVVCESVPEVPVIVMVLVPVVAVLLAVKVTELLDVVGLEPKLAVTPAGKLDVARLTLPGNPLVRITVIVLLPLPPRLSVKLVGEADSEKSGVDGKMQLLAALENSYWIM